MGDIRILIVDSETLFRRMIKEYAALEGFSPDEAADGVTALKLFRRNNYQLVVVEAELPELDGCTVCRQIRKTSEVPVLITSFHSDIDDKMSAFEAGADDYLIKPFSPLELMARFRVFLQRSAKITSQAPPRKITYDGIQIDTLSRVVLIDEKAVPLTCKDFELLLYLVRNPNKALSRDTLLNDVWGDDFLGSDRTVDTHIKALRDHLKPYDNYIATVWGFGYKFEV